MTSSITQMEHLFQVFNETTVLLQNELQCTYLEALAETGENMFQGSILQDEVSEIGRKQLEKSYQTVKIDIIDKSIIRKSFQLAVLKGMKEHVQPNHQMTPDSIGLLLGYLTNRFTTNLETVRLLDPVVGTGNLVVSLLEQWSDRSQQVHAVGIDLDEVLLQLAYVMANLCQQPVELVAQDTLENWFIDPVDLVVADLPVGYYPNDEKAKEFTLKSTKGHSYAHHLIMEQSMRHTKEGGYLFFLVPNTLFESEEAKKLQEYLHHEGHIQAFMQLPQTLFTSEATAKSLLVIQKKGEAIQAPQEVLLAKVPSLSNQTAMQRFLADVENWFQQSKQ
ncbi:class I SAM-dependent methyltransferase [Mangrovibacillus cuniculi]|uniref:Class I SAM-dependent methyltransferase n=1 Tax=Mangrovibacillus cuniculi TaxID=2593652 RepID=A0A7S8HFV9_9BACI|nr:class I SAM-dependent methyltransferase [Mangrovibacillus cuniculi]QPC47228.1 class I SAM-dependent methyltransferase [Mangrovibacillus cuniculi]